MDFEFLIKTTERILLICIAIATVCATVIEISPLISDREVELADLLLLFIYTEVLGMVGVFYRSGSIFVVIVFQYSVKQIFHQLCLGFPSRCFPGKSLSLSVPMFKKT